MIFTFEEKVVLMESIKRLTVDDWYNIYNILKNNKEAMTIKNEEILIDLKNISNNSLEQIKKYIDNLHRSSFE